MNNLLLQLIVLSLYLLFTGFCFCDGFKLHITRKLIRSAAFKIPPFRAGKEYAALSINPEQIWTSDQRVEGLLWFVVFVIVAISVFKSTQLFILEKILPLPLILAFVLCWFEKGSKGRNKSA